MVVLWSTLIWAIALFFSTVIADGVQTALHVESGGQYARVLLPLLVATFASVVVPRGIAVAVLGIVLYAMTAVIEARFTGWAFRGQNR